MCQVVIYENPQCRCRWLQICQQCKPNAGFSQCDKFGKRGIKYPPDEYESLQCPIHDLGGWYDRNFVRMIIKETSGFRIGTGPSKKDPGFDVKCIVM